MESPSISSTEFIQNDSFSTPKSPRSPRMGQGSTNSGLVTTLKKSLEQTQNELNDQIFLNSELKIYKTKYEDLYQDYDLLCTKYETLESEKKFSDIEINNLRKETEELSSQLFSEANSMVSQARKETFNIKRLNEALKNQLNEKDNLIHVLKSQLSDLKRMFEEREDDMLSAERNNTNGNESSPIGSNISGDTQDNSRALDSVHPLRNISSKNNSMVSMSQTKGNLGIPNSLVSNISNTSNFIYAPTVQSLRYDVKTYQLFVDFGEKFYLEVKNSTNPTHTKSNYLEIKEHKFYRKLLHDDIEPALRLDEAPGVAWLSKKNLINSMLIGKASIEPIASVNEFYKTDIVRNTLSELSLDGSPVSGSNFGSEEHSNEHSNEPPVAFEDPCSLCGEERNDTLDHTRLYVLKVMGTRTIKKKKDPTSPINKSAFGNFLAGNNNSKNTISITEEYVANQHPLCSYCLHRVRSVCELFAFLRGVKSGIWKFDTTLNCQKNWIECVRIRTKIFYSRIGIIESSHNLINNNAFSFSAHQITSADDNMFSSADGKRNSGYFSNYGSRLSSPKMTNFGSMAAFTGGQSLTANNTSNEPDSDQSSTKTSGYFSNRSSIIGSLWNSATIASPSPNSSSDNVKMTKKKEEDLQKLERTIDEVSSPVMQEDPGYDALITDNIQEEGDSESIVSHELEKSGSETIKETETKVDEPVGEPVKLQHDELDAEKAVSVSSATEPLTESTKQPVESPVDTSAEIPETLIVDVSGVDNVPRTLDPAKVPTIEIEKDSIPALQRTSSGTSDQFVDADTSPQIK